MAKILCKRFSWLVLMLLLGGTYPALAQLNVTGKVTASDDQSAMPGVNVVEKGTTNGAVTDADGNYTVTVGDNATLVFSFVGYQSQEVAVSGRSTINIALEPEATELTEVVVTGYTTQSKRDITGAVATVSAEEIGKTPVQDIGSALKGRVAGVTVDEQGGPGSPGVVRIRGLGTLGNNDPLYVIDGVQMRGSNTLVNLNDIETMTVLKDPSTAALYGAEGGNGVIVITTKKGKFGAPKLEYSTYFGTERPINYQKMLTPQQYADAYWGYLDNSGLAQSDLYYGNGSIPMLPDFIIETQSGTPMIVQAGDPAADPSLYNLANYRILKTNKSGTNWFKEILKPGFTQNHQLSLSGASDKTNYAVTFNYTDNKGIILETYFKRYSLRVNTNFEIKRWLRVGENVEFSYSEGSNINNHDPNNIMADLYKRSPLIPVYDIAGNYSGPKGISDAIALHPGGNNPVLSQKYFSDHAKGFDAGLIGSAFVDVEPLKGLVYESKIGAQLYPFEYHYFYDTFPQNIFSSDYNQFTEGGGYSSDWRWTNKLSYDLEINNVHKISAFVAYEARRFVSRYHSGTTFNLPYTTPSFLYLNNGVPLPAQSLYNLVSGDGDETTNLSIFGNINYSLKDRYLLSVVLRRDGSSKFGVLNRYGVFPSVSAGWRISDESFMSKINWLSHLKLRGAWGTSGNDAIPSGLTVNQYSLNTYVDSYDLGGTNNSAESGFGLYQIGNPYLQWEVNKTTNIGFDAEFFNSRVTASFDWFNRITDHLLYVPPATGLQGDALAPYENVMKFANKGVELQLGYNGQNQGPVRYDMNFNFATYRNEVQYISQDTSAFVLGSNYFPTHFSMNKSIVGKPVASFYGYVYEGIFRNPEEVVNHATESGIDKTNPDTGLGHVMFKDVNNDGVINEDDRTFIGNPHPKFTFGYNVNLYYKNFDLGVFVEGTYGNDIFNYWRAFTRWPGALGAGSDETWSPSNPNASLPIWASATGATDDIPSSLFIEDGSYVRIKSLELGYNLKQINAFSKFRIYAQVYNLATITGYSGIDPQVSTGDPGSIGVDYGGNYPIARKFLIGLSIGL